MCLPVVVTRFHASTRTHEVQRQMPEQEKTSVSTDGANYINGYFRNGICTCIYCSLKRSKLFISSLKNLKSKLKLPDVTNTHTVIWRFTMDHKLKQFAYPVMSFSYVHVYSNIYTLCEESSRV